MEMVDLGEDQYTDKAMGVGCSVAGDPLQAGSPLKAGVRSKPATCAGQAVAFACQRFIP